MSRILKEAERMEHRSVSASLKSWCEGSQGATASVAEEGLGLSVGLSFGLSAAALAHLSRWALDEARAPAANWTPGVSHAGVRLAVEVAEQQDEGERVSHEDVLHPSGEGASSQDGVESQHDSRRELDLHELPSRSVAAATSATSEEAV